MHTILEEARKAAGISGMRKNYPDNSKQRGCGYWAAYNALGNLLIELNKPDEAEEFLRQSLKIKPEQASIYHNLGVALQSLGRIDEAAAAFRKALKINPGLAEPYRHLAMTKTFNDKNDPDIKSI